MPVHQSITFKVPNTLDEVYEVVARPREFFALLPIPLEFKSFRGSDVVVYLNAFGFKGEAVFSFVVTRGANKVNLESSMIGELVMGFFRPPRMDLSFRITATKIDGGTEITFQLYVKLGSLRERLSGITSETERFVSKIPEGISEALRRVSVKPEAVPAELSELPKPAPAQPAVIAAQTPQTTEEKEKKPEPVPAAPAHEPPVKEKIVTGPLDRAASDLYSNLLEDPIAVYRLTTEGKSVTTMRARYFTSLISTISGVSTKNGSPVYAILRGERRMVRLIVEGDKILGILLEHDGQVLKGEKALELLEKSEEEFVCALFAVSKETLESMK